MTDGSQSAEGAGVPAPRRARWGAAAVGTLLLAAAVAVPAGPAGAATTVAAQLTMSGVATASSPTGGTTVGVHPGDSVKITPSALPTAGAGPLNNLLNSVLKGITGIEVDVTGLPGHSGTVKLSNAGCKGAVSSVTVPGLKAGTYKFTYTLHSASLVPAVLGCTAKINLNGSDIKTLTGNGVAVDATSTYHGVIVAAADPPKGGISIQLPGVTVSGHVGPVTLPSIKVPGVSLPTIPVSIPSIHIPNPAELAKQKAAAAAAAKKALENKGLQQAVNFNGLPLTVPEMVVPHVTGGYVTSAGLGTDGSADTLTGTDLPGSGPVQYIAGPQTGTGGGAAGSAGGVHSIRGGGTDLRYATASGVQHSRSSGWLPLLVVLGGIALVMVGCGYTTRRVLARVEND